MNIEKQFGFDFEFKVIGNPGETDADFYCFPGALKGGWVEGVAVEFSDYGWCGSFADGGVSKKGISGVFSYPGAKKLLVVAKGQGYLVDPSNPEVTEELKVRPILGVYSNLSLGLIILHDFTRFTAFGVSGEEWKSSSLSYDGIKLQHLSDDSIKGEAWSAPENKWVAFTLFPDTGKYEGGAR